MTYRRQAARLHDCLAHGAGSDAELFIVEGESASQSVCRCRDERYQAVLPMQGKPLNSLNVSQRALLANDWFAALIDALDVGVGDTIDASRLRYQRVMLLFDPDADGIHCSVLLMMFFYRWMRVILQAGVVHVVRAPLFQITADQLGQPLYAYTSEQRMRIVTALRERGCADVRSQHYRGLANLDATTLWSKCLNPETRTLELLTLQDAEAAIEIFTGSKPSP